MEKIKATIYNQVMDFCIEYPQLYTLEMSVILFAGGFGG